MKLEKAQFAELVQQIPCIDIELDWDGDEGYKKVEGHEMSCGKFLVFADFTVTESGVSDRGDYFTPPSFTSYGKHVFDVTVDVFIEETADEIKLTKEQEAELVKEIERILS